MEHLVACCAQSRVAAEQDVERTGVDDVADVLVRHADREVVTTVAVEVATDEGGPEQVTWLRDTCDAGGVLRPELVARGAEPAGRSVQHVDRAFELGPGGGADLLGGHSDGEVVGTVTVEVPGGQRRTEAVPGFRRPLDALTSPASTSRFPLP